MPSDVRLIDPFDPDPELIRHAGDLIRSGKLVAIPTETVYGLGANAFDPTAAERIYAAKGRPSTNPLIVHVADQSVVRRVAGSWPETAARLATAFWPGPLTMVVPRGSRVPDAVTAGQSTVAIRCPNHPVARAVIAAAGVPVAAPSANRSGGLSPTTAAHVVASLGSAVDLVLDAGPCHGGLESTVIDLTRPVPRLLRPGLVRIGMLEAIVGRVEVGTHAASEDEVQASPGMLARHYAPATRLEIAESDAEADALVGIYSRAGIRVVRWKAVGTAEEVAKTLYANLHTLDESGYDRIIATLPPDSEEWHAVRDRLTRAAAEK